MAATLAATLATAQQPSSPPAQAAATAEPIPAPGSQTFNTVITKLKAGKQIFSNTLVDPDLEAAKKACEGQDFIWIEMQHSTLTWRRDAESHRGDREGGLHSVCARAVGERRRYPESTDAGALGIIIPMVSTVEEARNAVLFAKFPVGNRQSPNTKPWGHRSSGNNRATAIWGRGYPTNANNNILIMIQIENPAGVGMIDTLLDEVDGIDIVMVASNDFGIHGGDRDGSPSYNAREKLVRDSVLAHGKILSGPVELAESPRLQAVPGVARPRRRPDTKRGKWPAPHPAAVLLRTEHGVLGFRAANIIAASCSMPGDSTLRQLKVQPRAFAIDSASAKHARLRASRCGPCFIPASLASKRRRGVVSAVPR